MSDWNIDLEISVTFWESDETGEYRDTRERRLTAFEQSLEDAVDEIPQTGGTLLTPEEFQSMKKRAREKALAILRIENHAR